MAFADKLKTLPGVSHLAALQLIGRTDIALFQTASYPPTLLLAGDTVRFVAEEVRL